METKSAKDILVDAMDSTATINDQFDDEITSIISKIKKADPSLPESDPQSVHSLVEDLEDSLDEIRDEVELIQKYLTDMRVFHKNLFD